ncbi:hypothetical protein B5S33_g99 [[Candida] boidinii]|nr:hypothetical protein B5S30_g187 [[Candida] boidinii]OWB81482.1 hypothetical protein B5S33_g99 [[Candida] boidinii]GMF99427.1 unnamed protein product [[Candida] boidinii]
MSNWKKLFNKGKHTEQSSSNLSPSTSMNSFTNTTIPSSASTKSNSTATSSSDIHPSQNHNHATIVADYQRPPTTTVTSETMNRDTTNDSRKTLVNNEVPPTTSTSNANPHTTSNNTNSISSDLNNLSLNNSNSSNINSSSKIKNGRSDTNATVHNQNINQNTATTSNESTDELDGDLITKNLENTDPVMENGDDNYHSEPYQQQQQQQSSKAKLNPGLLTVKLYSCKDISLPVSLKINKQILSKLATLGVNINSDEINRNIESLNESNDTATIAKCLPSTLQISNSNSTLSGEVNKSMVASFHMIYAILEVENSNEHVNSIGNTISNTKFSTVTTFDITSPNTANLLLHLYAKIPASLLESNKQEDFFIGSCRISLDEKSQLYHNNSNSDGAFRMVNHEWQMLYNPNTREIAGLINITLDFKPLNQNNKSLGIEDFDLLKVIGKGSFGKVMQVRKKDTGKIYALKSIRKSHIVNKMEVTHTLAEKFVLSRVNSPFIVPLKFAFQSSEKLYLVLSFINGGELFYHLQQARRFPLVRAKFYICELLSAIETLHGLNIVYRDLKPENILLDYQGHIALCDFGLCKINMKLEQKTNTFCGTPEYLAPELLLGKGYTRVVDFWTLGVLLYEMLTSLPPFYDEDVNIMYKKILHDPLVFPNYLDSKTCSLIKGLLNRDPRKRLGYNGVSEIKNNPFFDDVDWNKLNSKGYIPPYKPPVKDNSDTSNISSEFTNEKPMDSVVDDYLSESVQKQFGGWTYVGSYSASNAYQNEFR